MIDQVTLEFTLFNNNFQEYKKFNQQHKINVLIVLTTNIGGISTVEYSFFVSVFREIRFFWEQSIIIRNKGVVAHFNFFVIWIG